MPRLEDLDPALEGADAHVIVDAMPDAEEVSEHAEQMRAEHEEAHYAFVADMNARAEQLAAQEADSDK